MVKTPAERASQFRYFRHDTFDDKMCNIFFGEVDPYPDDRYGYTNGPRRFHYKYSGHHGRRSIDVEGPDRRKSNIGRKYRGIGA